ncbi:hypothetical protein SAMN05216489_00044 [Streptomyces sp. 3213]|uniref:hypothetical protein n=1 Tax=Streptomyces sp. 3213.3 TaxID=1855348 RepID=UPI00089759E1|nr:hypothetical protein [Streptomyces sp. 3213.3]SEC16368.1 hypothetical protein SAMN05216489_00044 [Streptomyces sp. 3213] [Streptomyces sp. 3213.3]
MNTWTTTAPGRRLAALTLTAALGLGAAGCSDTSPQQDRLAAASASGNASPREQLVKTGDPLTELQGQNGLSLTITSAERDPAAYLTIRADLRNDGAETAVVPAELRGDELAVLKTGPSLAGATITDFGQHKRYYVLRDTSGHPLTTTGLSTLKAGESVHVFMQFPAPPASTTEVGFQLPLFDTATIKISG